MFETHPFDAFAEIRVHLETPAMRDLARGGNRFTQEMQHVERVEGGDGITDQFWVTGLQGSTRAKHRVGGPLAFLHGPVIAAAVIRKDVRVNRVERFGHAIQQSRPMRLELLVK